MKLHVAVLTKKVALGNLGVNALLAVIFQMSQREIFKLRFAMMKYKRPQ